MTEKQISVPEVDPQSPLYIHPSDGPTTISIDKLTGAADYRPWRRTMEISLAAKRNLGFVTGAVKRDEKDNMKQELKYKLNKEVYDTHQNGASVSEYYTAMKSLWDEQDSLNLLPSITQLNPEIDAFVGAMKKQKEEERLFQFLLGIAEDYHAQRSQLLMQTPLPTVEAACAQLQQEETQRDVLQLSKLTLDSSAMLSKGKTEDRGSVTCEACGKRGHKAEKCWTVVGYPKWHNKYKKTQRKEGEYNGSNQRWSKGKGQRMVANVQAQGENEEPILTTQQVEQLLKLLPCGSGGKKESMEDEVIEEGFAGITTCCYSYLSKNERVIDTGATDHMICDENQLSSVVKPKRNSKINLPDGKSVGITYVGTLTLENQLELKHVLCVPEFKHNLLSVKRLTKDNNCKVVFGANVCLIQDLATQSIKGIGKVQEMMIEDAGDHQAKLNDDMLSVETETEETNDQFGEQNVDEKEKTSTDHTVRRSSRVH
ncbi:Retrovirus-related Pol polyprotein from transposon RE2 [Bienertia sinuspersici]